MNRGAMGKKGEGEGGRGRHEEALGLSEKGTVGQNQVIIRYQIIHFLTS